MSGGRSVGLRSEAVDEVGDMDDAAVEVIVEGGRRRIAVIGLWSLFVKARMDV